MKRITLIIPFRNEGQQVYKTIKSFLEFCDPEMFDIICIDDKSDDEYDYSEILSFPNTKLIYNEERLGVAGSRDKGAAMSNTEYIFFLDGHMRIFNNVISSLLENLDNSPRTLFCCQSRIIRFNEEKKYWEMEDNPITKGVIIRNEEYKVDFLDYDWDVLDTSDFLYTRLPIQCVMGACYAISRDYYLELHGLNGLQQWGYDEQFLSAKVYMSGGSIYLLKDIHVAHIYRTKDGTVRAPYTSYKNIRQLNKLILLYLLDSTDKIFNNYVNTLIDDKILKEEFLEFYILFDSLLPFLDIEKESLKEVLSKHTLTEYLKWKKP